MLSSFNRLAPPVAEISAVYWFWLVNKQANSQAITVYVMSHESESDDLDLWSFFFFFFSLAVVTLTVDPMHLSSSNIVFFAEYLPQ